MNTTSSKECVTQLINVQSSNNLLQMKTTKDIEKNHLGYTVHKVYHVLSLANVLSIDVHQWQCEVHVARRFTYNFQASVSHNSDIRIFSSLVGALMHSLISMLSFDDELRTLWNQG